MKTLTSRSGAPKAFARALATVGLCALAACTSSSAENTSYSVSTKSTPIDSSEFACLREAVYFEAGHLTRSIDGGEAVAHVILNRAAEPEFPNSVCGVIADKCQFSYRCDGIPEVFNEPRRLALAEEAALAALQSRDKDITNGALFFHAASMAPGWFGTLKRTGTYGGNIFYRPQG